MLANVNVHSRNFAFLAKHDVTLVRLATLAERYFEDDPSTCLIKLRQFAEVLARYVAAEAGIEVGAADSFEGTLRRLRDARHLPREPADIFHHLRKLGNAAAHENQGTHAQALSALKLARELGVWFHRTYAQPSFAPGPFIPPRAPQDTTPALVEEIAAPRAKLTAAQAASEDAERRATDEAQQRLSIVERLKQQEEERAFWETYAAETEAEKARITAALEELRASRRAEPPAQMAFLLSRAEQAAERIEIDEADTRAMIDAQLVAAGWEADSTRLRYSLGTRPERGRAMAIAEWPAEGGRADYALFLDGRCVGVVEAKRAARDVPSALDQAVRYAKTIRLGPEEREFGSPYQHGLDAAYRVPFVFATNGRSFVKQLETKSGIWAWDARQATNRPVALPDWFSPRDLEERLSQEVATSAAALRDEPFDYANLRPYQQDAITAIEAAIARGQRSILVTMATGTGKTLTCIALMYRLLKHKRFRRILFVVDRKALGEQTQAALENTELEGLLKFAQTYNVAVLGKRLPGKEDRVHVATVQSLIRRIFASDEESDRPSPGMYDLVIVDEAHRGYTLDAEMREEDIEFRSTEDYLSQYRRVLDYFDATRIGLTATPALHTKEIFGDPVFYYGYRQAVIEGYLIDHLPPRRITTALSVAGITFNGGEQVNIIDPRSGEVDLFTLDDSVAFEVDAFNRRVHTREFNRVVSEALAGEIPPDAPGKTLIFAARDDHVDIVVDELRKAFEAEYGPQPHDLVQKITGAVERTSDKIRQFRNDVRPKYVVTVDLLTTGVDIPAITSIVFLRRVNSRILYDQMMGRATRRCDEIGKEYFRIFDAVDLYANLQEFTEMRPVVVDPSLSFGTLVSDLVRAPTDEDRRFVHDQLVVKLRRRVKHLTGHESAAFAATVGRAPIEFVEWMRQADAGEVAQVLSENARLVDMLDAPARRNIVDGGIYVSEHPDDLVDVADVFDTPGTAEDYITAFERFVRENMNVVPGLIAATQRPRELTRKELKEVAALLDGQGFSQVRLQRAYGRVRNADIAAHIIGFVRQAALGDPLVPYETRVDNALARIEQSRPWTTKQKQWLRRIGRALREQPVGDRDVLDQPVFRQHGGFAMIDREFGGDLESVLKDLNEAIWTTPAA
jgi:type I restriction enzyme R subunit